jgi:carboxymethylenebutenolidase
MRGFAVLAIALGAALAGPPPPPPQIVTFPSGTITLSGALFAPAGSGPFPAVVYNHGSAAGMLSKQAFDALGPVFVRHGWVFFGPYRRGQGLSAQAGPYIGDEIDKAKRTGGVTAGAAVMVRLLETDHLDDQLAALSWTLAPALQQAMMRAVQNARAPMLFFQAENDWNLEPTKALSKAMQDAGKPFEAKIYPSFGKSHQDGHTFGYFGSAVWERDVFRFLEQHCPR